MKNCLLYCGFILGLLSAFPVMAQECLECHTTETPNIVSDWQLSKHSDSGIGCAVCHGSEHSSAEDANQAAIPAPETCNMCHSTQVEQYKSGKHAMAWAAMKAMPTIHWQPMELIEGQKGCGGCHKIGLKSEEEIKQ
ncbi:MAG TPA: multiheme c-type cytochrome, partial [bacterium]|nr:multiheme c-type cytochrome [bacterium]